MSGPMTEPREAPRGIPEWFPDLPDSLRFLTAEEGAELIAAARQWFEAEAAAGVHLGDEGLRAAAHDHDHACLDPNGPQPHRHAYRHNHPVEHDHDHEHPTDGMVIARLRGGIPMTEPREALAALLHKRCIDDWNERFANGAAAITMHGEDAHHDLAAYLIAAGVHLGDEGLDARRMGRALHRVFNHGYHGGGQDDGDSDLGHAVIAEYARLTEGDSR